MRIPRQRIFKICINGTDEWVEQAGNRTVLETQHRFSVEMPGAFVRVREQYLGGAKAPLKTEDEEVE